MIRHWAVRIASVACLASAMLWVFSLIAAILTLVLNPWDHHVTLTADFRFGVWSAFDDSDPSLVFFNMKQGPYRGSLITVEGDSNPPVVTGVDCEFPRIYYRHIRRDDEVVWTLIVSLWYPLILFAIGPVLWGASRWRSSGGKKESNTRQELGNG